MTQDTVAPFRDLLDFSLQRLNHTFSEALTYIRRGDDLTAIGCLATAEEDFADLKAALRLISQVKNRP
jgi:hypothetical protein